MHKTKNIAINAWVLRNRSIDGIGNFTIQTTIQLSKINPNLHFHVLVDWNFKEIYFNNWPNITINRIFPPRRHPILYIIFLDTILPIFLAWKKIDIFLGMDGMLSLLSSKKQISVIHDLNFKHYPHFLPFRNRLFYNYFFPLYAQKATKIATVSEFSKNDIVQTYHINPDKIKVVFCAAKEFFHSISEYEKTIIRQKYTLTDPFFVVIGTIHPRKNIENTLKAFSIFLNKINKPYKLILIGDFLWNNSSNFNLIRELKIESQVIFAGRLSDEETNDILASAEALLFMSYFEGFGIPILEAFSTSTPVICSNTTSLDEISDDAALKANPIDPEEISNKMIELIKSENKKLNLITSGTKRLNFFSWEKTAQAFIQIII